MLSLARAKSKSLELANAARTGENKAFSAKSTQYMRLKRHKESYNTELETRKKSMKQLES